MAKQLQRFMSLTNQPVLYDKKTLCPNVVDSLGNHLKIWKNLFVNNIINTQINILQGEYAHNVSNDTHGINIISNNTHTDRSIFLHSVYGGITLDTKQKIVSSCDIFIQNAKSLLQTIENDINIMTTKYVLNTNFLNVKSNEGIHMDGGNGKIKFYNTFSNPNSFEINIPKGGINIFAHSPIYLNSNQSVNIGGANCNLVNIGNNTGDVVIQNNLTVKGMLYMTESSCIEKYITTQKEIANLLEFDTNVHSELQFDFALFGGYESGRAGLQFKHTDGSFHLAKQLGEYKNCQFLPPVEYADLFLQQIHANKVQATNLECQHLLVSQIQSPNSVMNIRIPNVVFQSNLRANQLFCNQLSINDSFTVDEDGNVLCSKINNSQLHCNLINTNVIEIENELMVKNKFKLVASHQNHIGQFQLLSTIAEAVMISEIHNDRFILTDGYREENENITISCNFTLLGKGGVVRDSQIVINNQETIKVLLEQITFVNCVFFIRGTSKLYVDFKQLHCEECVFYIDNRYAVVTFSHCDISFTSKSESDFFVFTLSKVNTMRIRWTSIVSGCGLFSVDPSIRKKRVILYFCDIFSSLNETLSGNDKFLLSNNVIG